MLGWGDECLAGWLLSPCGPRAEAVHGGGGTPSGLVVSRVLDAGRPAPRGYAPGQTPPPGDPSPGSGSSRVRGERPIGATRHAIPHRDLCGRPPTRSARLVVLQR